MTLPKSERDRLKALCAIAASTRPVRERNCAKIDLYKSVPALLAALDEAEAATAKALATADGHREYGDKVEDVLTSNGFVRCDVPACNCGSWHHRFGYPERFDEFKEALDEAGHPVCNDNGNKPLSALRELVAERDAARAESAALREQVKEVATALREAADMSVPDDELCWCLAGFEGRDCDSERCAEYRAVLARAKGVL
jgi:hypothetical protein